ncbi:MAG: PepSY-associated TM helix domain-containing protein [Bacteroidota bacterium]
MKFNRKTFFKIHQWIGIKLSILFFVVCISGTFATISHEIDWLIFPGLRATPSEELASRNNIREAVAATYPEGKITFWWGAEEDYLCDILYVENEGQRWYVFANRRTGDIQGATTLTFQRFMRDLHYFLFIPFQIGHFTVLIFGFLLFISLGTALYFYKKWYTKLFELKTGKGKVVLFRSLHRLVGVWSVPFVLLFSVTGIWYFMERTNIAGIAKTANMKTPTLETAALDSTDLDQFSYQIDYDAIEMAAQQHIPNIKVSDIIPPSKVDQPIYLTGKSDIPLVRNRANRVYLHPTTYELIDIQKAEAINTRTWLNDIADPLHFGYFGGLVTKLLWFFGGLGISGLVLTGFWISQKRKVRSERQQKMQRMGKWKPVNIGLGFLTMGFMYAILINRYAASIALLIAITIIISLLITAWWYVFDYRIRKVVERELAKA